MAFFKRQNQQPAQPKQDAWNEWAGLFQPHLVRIPELVDGIPAHAAATALRDQSFGFIAYEGDEQEAGRLFGLVLALAEACEGKWEYPDHWSEVMASYALAVRSLRERGREDVALPAQDVVLAISKLAPWEK